MALQFGSQAWSYINQHTFCSAQTSNEALKFSRPCHSLGGGGIAADPWSGQRLARVAETETLNLSCFCFYSMPEGSCGGLLSPPASLSTLRSMSHCAPGTFLDHLVPRRLTEWIWRFIRWCVDHPWLIELLCWCFLLFCSGDCKTWHTGWAGHPNLGERPE